MLKITYRESELLLEQLSDTVESVVAQRMMVYTRSGRTLIVEPTYAAIPLTMDLPGLQRFIQSAHRLNGVQIDQCDHALLEVSLQGVWLADATDRDEGIFLTTLPTPLEKALIKLWCQSQCSEMSTSVRSQISY